MTPSTLAELERLEREATPGPWIHPEPDEDGTTYEWEVHDAEGSLAEFSPSYKPDEDGRLVVALRNAAPELFRAVREGAKFVAGHHATIGRPGCWDGHKIGRDPCWACKIQFGSHA